MSEEIQEVIKKLEMYQAQIKEQTKKDIVEMVSEYDEKYFWNVSPTQIDPNIELINYRIKTVNDIEKMIDFLNINYNPVSKEAC